MNQIFSDELGVLNYVCDFAVADVLKGDASLTSTSIKVDIVRFEMGEGDRHPLVKKGAKSILFLKKRPTGYSPDWVTSDFWLGV